MHTIDDYDHLSNSFPFSSLPLLILQSAKFHKAVYSMVEIINSKYKEMLAGNVLDEMNHEVTPKKSKDSILAEKYFRISGASFQKQPFLKTLVEGWILTFSVFQRGFERGNFFRKVWGS